MYEKHKIAMSNRREGHDRSRGGRGSGSKLMPGVVGLITKSLLLQEIDTIIIMTRKIMRMTVEVQEDQITNSGDLQLED